MLFNARKNRRIPEEVNEMSVYMIGNFQLVKEITKIRLIKIYY